MMMIKQNTCMHTHVSKHTHYPLTKKPYTHSTSYTAHADSTIYKQPMDTASNIHAKQQHTHTTLMKTKQTDDKIANTHT